MFQRITLIGKFSLWMHTDALCAEELQAVVVEIVSTVPLQ